MIDQVLSLFPAYTHPLILVSDPDNLLGGEATRVELTIRGFTLVQETDPVLLRRRVVEARLPSIEHPLLIITPDPLGKLPYDLWQPGYRIELSLHQYFPNLAYPVLQTLHPSELEMLSQVAQPDAPLGRQKTIEFLLKEIFDADPARLSETHQLIGWLTRYHQANLSMPPLLRDFLVERLKRTPAFRKWNLAGWISNAQVFSTDLQSQWTCYVQAGSGQKNLGEDKGKYFIPFEKNNHLQEMIPDLVRKRVLKPVEVPDSDARLQDWAAAGVTRRDARSEQIQILLEDLSHQVSILGDANWEAWKQAARQWADLNVLLFSPDLPEASAWNEPIHALRQALDQTFYGWLKNHYALLGAQRLPRPSHVHHIPHYLAYQREMKSSPATPGAQGPNKVALIILDGMSLADWSLIQSHWSQRNAKWQIQTDLLLAQIPTITALSRYALISGLRPSDFASHLDALPTEEKKWQLFWTNKDIPQNAIGFERLLLDRAEVPASIEGSRLQALCLIDDTLDLLTHNATLGATDQHSSLRLWLDAAHSRNSLPLESLISRLLDRQFTVFLSSDHGHMEAIGFGQPSEGLVTQTRGKRARIYQDRNAALQVQSAFPETILWENDGLNPSDLYTLMPTDRRAFAPYGEVVVTHGGVTLDEVVVPFIRIEKKA